MLNAPAQFGQPWLLLLLLALPFFPLLARWSRSGLERGRSVVSTILRMLLFAAIVCSLADLHWVSRSYRTATVFLLDHSYSIPQDVQRGAIEWVNKQIKEVPKDDVAGVVLFGDEAMIEVPTAEHPTAVGPSSVVTRSATDIGAAIRLALAIFPEGYQRRIVVLSDGNDNKGAAPAEAELARAHGVTIDVFPLRYEYPNEVWIESLHVPPDLLPREPFDATVVVNSQRAGPGTLTIYRNGELLSTEKVELNKGKNVFAVKQKIEEAGSYTYKAVIEMAGDTVSQNNVGHASAVARGEARIAVIPGDPVDAETLVQALREEGLHATVFAPEDILRGMGEPAAYDAIILANAEAAQVSAAGMRAMEAAVHDAGVGFIMVGGERSYGPGGWRGTPIEELLPVTMEQPQRRVMPNGALCLVLHTCEIPEGNYWAKQIGIAALNVLNPLDYMGVLLWDGSDRWLFQMQRTTDRRKLAALINGASPSDMPSFDGTMNMAHQGLKMCPAASKHIVIISDADPSGPPAAMVDAIVKDKITISTIAINPHGASDVQKMQAIARRANGRFYNVNDPNKLPQIFIKEAATVQRSMIIEGKISPVVLGAVEALKGIAPAEIPPLHGYTLAAPKNLSRTSMGMPLTREEGDTGPRQHDALLCEWTYGLGKTMAFTSDAKPRWAKDWVAWPKYRKFWSQAVRSVLRTVPRAPYSVQTEIEGGRGKVIVDAIDERGQFIPTLQFSGSVTSPEGTKTELQFRQVGPGRYEAGFEANKEGSYNLSASFEGAHGEKGFISRGVPLSYPPEYRDLKTNMTLLDQLWERTGGRRLGVETPVYAPMARAAGIAMPLWPWLLAAVLALFPIDIFIRRVAVEWGALVRRAFGFLILRRAPKKVEVPATLRALAAKKQEVRAEQLSQGAASVDLDALGPARPLEAPSAPKPAAAPPPAPKKEEQADYMQRLLDAKKKAKKKE